MMHLILQITVVFLGLITGSFLNAVIHRLPRSISLMHPKRSFCPSCGKTIPWYENLPVASWVLLRGKCSGCALPIAIRYPLVELLTGGLYLLAWERYGLPVGPVSWIFLSLLIAATFIDIDHLIIPDEITLGGTAAGLLLATVVPQLLGQTIWWKGFLWSACGAAGGYFLLWGVVELGKMAFGKRRVRCEEPSSLELLEKENDVFLKFGEEEVPLSDFLSRTQDRVAADCVWLEVGSERFGSGRLLIGQERVVYQQAQEEAQPAREWSFTALPEGTGLRGEVTELTLPREAMGFGDVKFLACIGAFLGWKGVLFSLFSGSVIGAVIGVATLAATSGRSGGRIPFGPYLALGALLWLLCGEELMHWYFGRFHGLAFFLSSPLQMG